MELLVIWATTLKTLFQEEAVDTCDCSAYSSPASFLLLQAFLLPLETLLFPRMLHSHKSVLLHFFTFTLNLSYARSCF